MVANDKTALPNPGASQVRRAFLALEALIPGPRAAADIARVLGVNRSTALRLMNELESIGYVHRDPTSRYYSISSARIYPLVSSSQSDHSDWSAIVDPILSELRDEFGEATLMGVPANGAMVYLAFFPSLHIVTVRERLGTARPMYCSALGKAYLSALDGRALDDELALLTYHGGTRLAPAGPLELRQRIEETRVCGYAIDRNETFDGGTCVATPARVGGTLVGAIGLSGPSSRISDQRIAQMGQRLIDASRRLTNPSPSIATSS
jgi:DNA-binding IclR family transcriptional regulator